jgi:hypothetical protein
MDVEGPISRADVSSKGVVGVGREKILREDLVVGNIIGRVFKRNL